MGYTVGSAVAGRLALKRDPISGKPNVHDDVRYAAVVATGYHGNEDGPTLYVYDALGTNVALQKNNASTHGAGGLIKKLTYTDGNLKHKSSLSSPIMVDLDYDGVVDVAYAGDQNGNLYRFDFRGATPDNWRVDLLYEGSPDKPITSAPAFSNYGNKNVVIFGTGSELYDSDVSGRVSEQSIYGVIDDLDSKGGKKISKALLVEQKLTEFREGGKKVRTVSNNSIPTEKKGWYVDFKGGLGEAVVASPQVLNGTVFFTTKVLAKGDYADARDVCFRSLAKDAGWSMALNTRTGGALSKKDTSYVSFVRKDGSSLAGVNSDDGAYSQVQVLYLNDSPLTSADGQVLASNSRDFALDAAPGKMKDSARCKTLAEAHIIKGTTPTREEIRSCTASRVSRVRVLSWREIF